MPTGGYFLLDAAKTFAAQENWQIRDNAQAKIAFLSAIFWPNYFCGILL